MTNDQDRYDVFLSHSSVQKSWVEALARNLEAAGKRVFLDKWHLVPGQNYIPGLHEGIRKSRAAVLVVSPEAYHSGWVAREYEAFLSRAAQEPGFPIIPLIHGAVDAPMPFADLIHSVDFRPPVPYREAFARLLCGLDRHPPGPSPRYDGPLTEPEEAPCAPLPPAGNPVSRVMRKLDANQIAVLLTRDGQLLGRVVQDLKEAAENRFAPHRIRLIALPWTPEGRSLAPFFRSMARQAGLGDGIDTADGFYDAMRERMAEGRWLLIVTAIEALGTAERIELAREIRRQTHVNSEFSAIFIGGERLYDLVYGKGVNSELGGSETFFWPDAGEEDVRRQLPAQTCQDATIPARILTTTGAHPGSIVKVVETASESGNWTTPAMEEAVVGCDSVWNAIDPLLADEERRSRLRRLATAESVGVALAHRVDPLLRHLFWRNLVKEVTNGGPHRLVWRSPAIRRAIETALTVAEECR